MTTSALSIIAKSGLPGFRNDAH